MESSTYFNSGSLVNLSKKAPDYLTRCALCGAMVSMLNFDDMRVNKRANVKRANFRYPAEQCFSRFVFEHFLKPFFKHHANNSDVVEAHLCPVS